MRALATAFTLLLGPAALVAHGRTETDILRARCNEQERQIRALEAEIESLHSQLALERRRSRGVEPSAAPASPLPPAPEVAYLVKSGDTLSSIARRYRTSADLLMKTNGIEDPTRLRVGQKLDLPPEAKIPKAVAVAAAPQPAAAAEKPAPKPQPAPAPAATEDYKVQRGDTLYGIARMHKMSISRLKALNPKVGDKIVVGQNIKVSGTPAMAATPSLGTSRSRTISAPAPKPKAPAAKPAPPSETPAASAPKPAEEAPKPAPAPAPDDTVVKDTPKEEPAPAAPKTISSIIVMDEVSLGALAAKHGTTTEQLNALNNWNYKSNLILARGSEVYVPGR